jgi:hypothetical protein
VAALLRIQVRELRLWWETEEKEHIDRFHKARSDAWDGIELLLGPNKK